MSKTSKNSDSPKRLSLADKPGTRLVNWARKSKRILTYVVVSLISILAVGCNDKGSDESLPASLKIGVLPDENKDVLTQRYEPLRLHLVEKLGVPCELIIPDSYDALVKSFGEGTLDMAYFGGLTYVQAKVAYDAVPLIMRDIDARFTSLFIVKSDSRIQNITETSNGIFAFGSRQSTSGHLMPRHFLTIQDIVPESFFQEIRYSGSHDRTVEWVRDGTADSGAVNSQIFKTMLADGRLKDDEVRVLWETPPYPDYVWAVQPTLGADGRKILRDAFLSLSPDDVSNAKILKGMNAGGFLPIGVDAFSPLEVIAEDLGLL